MSIDLRVEFEGILKKWGQNIFLQRVKTPFVDPVDCEEKYSRTLEKHTVRSMNVLASRFLGDTKIESDEGIEFPTEMIFWFKHNVNPISGDRIYMPVPRYPLTQYPIYEIDHADPKYGLGGRIEFWACGSTRIRPE